MCEVYSRILCGFTRKMNNEFILCLCVCACVMSTGRCSHVSKELIFVTVSSQWTTSILERVY
ncbi:hypothetical protein JHK82_026987 [Glycine max]|uniref:Uncharacterized protein n=2 Tax=Glycine subgen. Soja TaxID=1462606 RepID=K7LHK8_SOYBN|nr:hypothetical protein JHK85_027611 [Glycine max]RZB85811.1 hypothetical protein D0Y65_026067 [Glycine soja]KAG5002973.1 hypothetical protein JHK86_027112 [Glycine max]KAG5126152.1 hypothetical protein JHK82_026987 [Glycine max]KAG5150746.1 hypothetical protein JHK84_027218 [Glycine max]